MAPGVRCPRAPGNHGCFLSGSSCLLQDVMGKACSARQACIWLLSLSRTHVSPIHAVACVQDLGSFSLEGIKCTTVCLSIHRLTDA